MQAIALKYARFAMMRLRHTEHVHQLSTEPARNDERRHGDH